MKVKKGDNVKILSGNDKDKTGEVLEVIPKENKIIVKGVKVMNYCPNCGKKNNGGRYCSDCGSNLITG